MRKKLHINFLKDILLPMFVTMAGVYLGLLASQWQSDQNNNALRKRIRLEIDEEVSTNLKRLQRNFEYHEKLRTFFAKIANESPDSLRKAQKMFQGLQITFFEKNAYQSANAGGSLKLFAFDEYRTITNLYNQQDAIELINRLYLQEFLKLVMDKTASEKDYMKFLIIFFNDINHAEKRLITNYEKWLKDYKNNN